jgi:hypothetical protein
MCDKFLWYIQHFIVKAETVAQAMRAETVVHAVKEGEKEQWCE